MGSSADGTSDPDQTVYADAASLAQALPPVSQTQRGEALPLGTRISEFEIKGFVGEGGFSIVYLAWDHSLDRHVALKEYMPSSLAMRTGATDVVVRSARHRETFEIGLRSFINEGKLLASFDHPSLVKVYRFWEAHGTAYMAMPYYEGTTLKHMVRAMHQPPDETWLRTLLDPLTEALSVIHGAHCYHRDIAPDNVMLLASTAQPLLLDFGAARRVIGDKTQALTVILKPGYAPIEQYAEDPALKQGPWTDVYALCAVIYWAVTGKTPPAAVGRMLNDAHVPLAQCAAGRYSPQFIAAVDRGLQVQPQNRTRTIRQLRRELGFATGAAGDASVDDDALAAVLRPTPAPAETATPSRRSDDRAQPAPSPKATAIAGTLAVLGVAAALVWWFASSGPDDVKRPAPVAAAPAPAPAPAPPPAEPPAPPLPSAPQALAQIVANRDPSLGLKASLRESRSAARLQYTALQAGYLHVFGLRAGGSELVMVHPTSRDNTPHKASLRGDVELPPPSSLGVISYQVLLAREPRELQASGWEPQGQHWVWTAGRTDSAWGPAQCPNSAPRCTNAYDMTEVTATPVADPPATPRPTRPEPKDPVATPAVAKPRDNAGNNSARCADALRRFSLGDTSPELIEQMKTLGCR